MSVTFGCVLSDAVWGPEASAETLRGIAQHAEDLGFDSVWVPDHLVIPRSVTSVYPYAADGASPFDSNRQYLETLSALNFLAGCTERVRLGTYVLIHCTGQKSEHRIYLINMMFWPHKRIPEEYQGLV